MSSKEWKVQKVTFKMKDEDGKRIRITSDPGAIDQESLGSLIPPPAPRHCACCKFFPGELIDKEAEVSSQATQLVDNESDDDSTYCSWDE